MVMIFKGLKTSSEIYMYLLLLSVIVGVFILNNLPGKFIGCFRKTKSIRELSEYYNALTIDEACKFYVQTKSQNYPPHYEDEPGFDSGNILKENLIDFFMKRIFANGQKKDRFYLVLASSGMGKTTFIINLYIKYTIFYNFRKKYKMKVFTFGGHDILKKIKKIKEDEAQNTILLLDAFDEDIIFQQVYYDEWISDQKRFKDRLDEIIKVVRSFRKVIITSRTQYFPEQKDRPYEMKIPTYSGSGFYTMEKIYLSPFDDDEIKKYLNKKYGVLKFWNRNKKKIAENIVKSSPRLMARPILLSYIDLLIEDNSVSTNIYDIYETLVEKWLDYEAIKSKFNMEEGKKFKEDLHKYSKLVANEIYENRMKTNTLSLSKDEALDIAKRNNINLSGYEITGRSLLAHDAEGNWKFAHRSVFEFMVAREIIENIGSIMVFRLEGMDMTEQFLREKDWEFTFIRGGTFLMGSPENETGRRINEKQHQVRVPDFFMSRYPVTIEQFEIFVGEENYENAEYENWRYQESTRTQKGYIVDDSEQDDKKYPVLHVTWNDAKAYCKWLSKKLNVDVRLSTEAEWEYACRAGTTTPFNTGENLTTEQANYDGNYPYNNNPKGKFIGKTTPVGNYPPNAWGLCDMHGNVWEWCEDLYSENYYNECETLGVVENPTGTTSGSLRVLRGGSWDYGAGYCRSAFRNRYGQDSRSNFIGFRVVIYFTRD